MIYLDRRRFVEDCIDASKLSIPLPYKFLNPLQTAFFRFWDGNSSAFCAAPTSAGKTGLIYLFFQKFGGRKIYLAPTKALCEEKYNEFLRLFGRKNVSLRTGDKFEFAPPETEYVIATYESCLASARSGSSWFFSADAICIDEVHFLMFGGSRGIFLEELIAYALARKKAILALSATIPKSAASDYAQWLGAKLFYSDWRPVPLERRIEHLTDLEKKIFGERIKGDIAERIVKIALRVSKSPKVIIFVYKKSLGWKILEYFDNMGYGVLNVTIPFERSTRVLSPNDAVVAFHNADIPFEERSEIEKAFREGKLRFLVATQTMAYGVNLPADEAIIVVRSWMSKMLPDTSTILQMEGRVGRFGISEKGISRIIPLSGENMLKKELERFFMSPDTRTSLEKFLDRTDREEKISDVDAMTLIVLGMIISNDIDLTSDGIDKIEKILSFMKTSFRVDVRYIVQILEDSGCIKFGKVTPLGRILASSLIPPSAYKEFMRRFWGSDPSSRIHSFPYIIRPLLFFKDFSKGFIDMLPAHLRYDLESKISDTFEEESILEIWMSGELWWYFRYPPSQFYLRPDTLQLVKLLSQLKFYGFVDLTLRDIMRVCMSLAFGVSHEFAVLCALPGIGFGRGGTLTALARELELDSPLALCEAIMKGGNRIRRSIYNILLRRAEFQEPSLRSEWAERDPVKAQERINIISRINSEVDNILGIFKDDVCESIRQDMLFDDEMARIMVFVKLGRESAIQMSKEDLRDFILNDGKIV